RRRRGHGRRTALARPAVTGAAARLPGLRFRRAGRLSRPLLPRGVASAWARLVGPPLGRLDRPGRRRRPALELPGGPATPAVGCLTGERAMASEPDVRVAPPPSTRRQAYLADAGLVGVTLIWGSTFIIIKHALGGVSPFEFVALRFGI